MVYLVKYDKFIKESFITNFFYKLIGGRPDQKTFNDAVKIEEVTRRLADEKLTFPELIKNGLPNAYNLIIRGYNVWYPKNNLLDDCETLMKHLQSQLYKPGKNTEALSEAIYCLNDFIEYYKYIKTQNGDPYIDSNIKIA